ncbi:MAG: recombinase family protein, partial [Planctomycetota bacterium]
DSTVILTEEMTYDKLNRMLRHEGPSGVEVFAYRGAEWHWFSQNGKQFLYDGDNVLADIDSDIDAFYVTPSLDQNLSITTGGSTYYYSQDGLGSVRTLTDSAGAVVNSYDFDYHNDLGGLSTIARRLNDEGIPSPDAGRKRNGKFVSGKWCIGTVRSILENPLYAGRTSWARHGEGSVFRYDDSPECARPLEAWEKQPDVGAGLSRKTVNREFEDWVTARSPIAYAPIVSPQVWLANYTKLRDRGTRGRGRRGVRRCTDPNKYPLPVICASCAMPMHGMSKKGTRTYVCSTYMNSNASKCAHNWIERDQAVAFTVNTVRQRLLAGGQMDALRSAIREVLCRRAKNRPKAAGEAKDLEQQLAELERQRKEAYREKMRTKDPIIHADAEDAYMQICRESRTLTKKLEATKNCLVELPTDIDSEVEACVSLLDRLDVFLKIPDNRLRQTFNALGVRLTINFDRAKAGRRKNVPVGGKLEFGVNGLVDVTTPVGGVSAKPRKRASRKRRTRQKTAKAKKREDSTSQENSPVAAATGLLGVSGRGDWI